MPYQFYENDQLPETQASGSRSGSPPRKLTGAGVLDGPLPAETAGRTHFPIVLLLRIAAAALLALIACGIFFLVFGSR